MFRGDSVRVKILYKLLRRGEPEQPSLREELPAGGLRHLGIIQVLAEAGEDPELDRSEASREPRLFLIGGSS